MAKLRSSGLVRRLIDIEAQPGDEITLASPQRQDRFMEHPTASVRMMSLVNGYLVSQAMYVAATLGIADHLVDGPRSAEELAAATDTKAGPLYRLLRALAAAGVFHESINERFSLTEMGHCLRKDAVEPVGGWAANIGLPYVWAAAGALLHSVRTGESGFQHVHGTNPWEYRAAHPDDSAIFDRAMTDLSRRAANGIVDAYSFEAFTRVVDIGGGAGALLATILAAYPTPRGVLFDQPHVVSRAGPILAAAGVAARCECIGGSFFDTAPGNGDAYILKSVLHDWGDEQAVAILRNCRAAISQRGKLLVIEPVVGPPNERPASKFTDLNMMIMLGARERTETEFIELLSAANFGYERIVPVALDYYIIEARPL